MPRKQNRAYKKGRYHRDHRKFIIVAEGEREDGYFSYFNEINARIVISLAKRDGGKSACKHFLERVYKYDDVYGIEPEDSLWFVLDVDNWKRSDIDQIAEWCKDTSNWNIAISNPCFEVWLIFHFGDPSKLAAQTAQTLKNKLNTLIPGGYRRETFAKQIKTATTNARTADKNPSHYYPDVLTSKVYNLSTEMLKFIGNTLE